MSLTSYPIRRIGPLALAELEISQAARLLGVTSRGLFILSNNQRVIFLSSEPYAGPWTANVLAMPPGWQAIMIGKSAQIQAGRIILPAAQAYFDAAVSEHWQPPAPDLRRADPAGLPQRRAAITRLLLRGEKRGLSPLLADLPDDIPDNLRPIQDALNQLCASLINGDDTAALQAGEALLGFGGGLTPSGDDLLCGLLLGLARWGAVLGRAIPAFAPALIESARQRTTALSASLMEAAAAGMADERLLLAADGLFTASASPEAIAEALLAYGNSSGLDFWIGLAQVMTLII